MKYLLLLIFISLLSLSLQISITQPTERSGNFIATQMCFGTPAECMSGALNFGSCKSFVADSTMRPDLNNQYRVGNSKTFSLIRPEPIDYTYESFSKKINGLQVSDVLTISKYKLGQINFYHASQSEEFNKLDGVLGICYNDVDGNFSALDLLQPHKVVSFQANTVTFGKLPDFAVVNYKQYGNCAVNELSEKWQCSAKGFILSNSYVEEGVESLDNKMITFDYGIEKSYVPLSFLLYLEHVYFKDLIKANECTFGFKGDHYAFSCMKNSYSLKPISFIFGDWMFMINSENMFTLDEAEGDYEFRLIAYDDKNEFIFGRNILKYFTMVFDKTNKQVGFYSGDSVIYIGKGDPQPPKTYEDPDTPITPTPEGGEKGNLLGKFFKAVGILMLIGVAIIIAFFIFRYIRRRRFPDQSYYYKATDDLFESGTTVA